MTVSTEPYNAETTPNHPRTHSYRLPRFSLLKAMDYMKAPESHFARQRNSLWRELLKSERAFFMDLVFLEQVRSCSICVVLAYWMCLRLCLFYCARLRVSMRMYMNRYTMYGQYLHVSVPRCCTKVVESRCVCICEQRLPE